MGRVLGGTDVRILMNFTQAKLEVIKEFRITFLQIRLQQARVVGVNNFWVRLRISCGRPKNRLVDANVCKV